MKTEETTVNSSPTIPASSVVLARFFYGWVVVGCAFTVLCVAYGIQFTFGVFMPAISQETGWDRASLSLPYSLYIFLYSALGVVTGRLTDRWGPRIVITVGGCLLSLGILLTSQVQTLWQMYLFFGLIAASGMSAAYVPCNSTVVRWFVERRGLALSLTSSGASFGNFLFPPLAATLIHAYGWRNSYIILGVLALLTISLCATFIARDPETLGLQPDGRLAEEPLPTAASAVAPFSSTDWTLATAQCTPAFWLLTVIFTLTWLVVFMPLVHVVPFAVDLGISPVRAAFGISAIGLGGFAGRLVIGAISDRCGRLPTLGLCLSLQAVAFLCFPISKGEMTLYSTAAVFGLSYGGITALFPALIGDFFGRAAVGSIVGFIFAVAGSPAAFGPLIAGYIYTASHSYTVAFLLSAALNTLALILLFFLKKPHQFAHKNKTSFS
ncbi:MAG: MFS transporter [Candidatus Binatia bacterium]